MKDYSESKTTLFLKKRAEISQFTNDFGKEIQASGISFEQFLMMRTIGDQQVFSKDLAKKLNVSRAAVSRRLDLLTRKGLAPKKHEKVEDHRKIEVKLTTSGLALLNETEQLCEAFMNTHKVPIMDCMER